MRKFLTYIYKSVLPERIRPLFDIFPALRTLKLNNNELNEKRIIILSPHPDDDDIITCGGTIYRYSKNGSDITSVYLTDGRKGNPDYSEDELVKIRKQGARVACEIKEI